jgi:hypothetical protein
MHADHHVKLSTGRACRESTVPCYAPHHPPPSTILLSPLLHAKGHRKQADSTTRILAYKMACQVALPQQHAQLATRLLALASLAARIPYTAVRMSRARPSSHDEVSGHEHPLALPTLPVVFSLLPSLSLPVSSHTRALRELSHDVQQA